MEPRDARENYYFYSGKASDVVRQLGLAAIAVVWVFKTEQAGVAVVPEPLLVAAKWAVLALALDFLQYLYGAAAWGILHRVKERQKAAKYQAPALLNWPTAVMFWGKAVAMAVSYASIFRYLSAAVVAAG